jgi:archaeosine synthase alpha-subunit
MRRSVEHLDGLALLGPAGFGPLGGSVPALLWSEGLRPERPAGDPIDLVRAPPTRPGHRALALAQGTQRWTVDFPILAPEVAGGATVPTEIAPGAWQVHWPPSPDSWSVLRAARPELLVLANARVLLAESEPFVGALADLRRELGAGPLLWTPRVALPHRLALLTYLSADLTDTTAGLAAASEGHYLDAELGLVDPAAAEAEGLCRCVGCRGPEPERRRRHAVEAYASELARVRAALRAGRLRELVELRLTSEPVLAELLRYADRRLGDRLEERTPVRGATPRAYVLRESFRRPEVRRFRERLRARYRPPPSKQLLVLVPCSRTKPYRSSRSHRRFAGALAGLEPAERIHLVSVTSPLGAVPRELEDVYPARHYDIPVTGEWDEAERTAVREAIGALLARGAYRSILVHLDPDEYGFLRGLDPVPSPPVWTMSDDRSTSPEALAALRREADRALAAVRPVAGGPLAVVREELQAIASVQFGPEAAERLFRPPVRLHGRPWFQRITDGGGTDLATWQEVQGLFQLTVAGAERLGPVAEVEVDASVRLTGDLFTPGVARADRGIRAGDAVRLVRHGELVAVGRALLPGPLMTELAHGRAVEVRHRVRGIATGAPTST